jgi:hypothetical protein
MMQKYFKPKSLTWWAGICLILTGLLRGTDAVFDLGPWAAVIDAWSGGSSASALILQGAGLIGIRGAIGEAGNV